MVAFFRGFVAALPPLVWPLSSAPETTAEEKREFEKLEALLAGKPFVEGPLITEQAFSGPYSCVEEEKTTPMNSSLTSGNNVTSNTTMNETAVDVGKNDWVAPPKLPPFTLYDWTVGFRESARLATSFNTGSPMTLMLTPGLFVEPPPYVMSRYGGGDSMKSAPLQPLQPAADYEHGQLLLEAPPLNIENTNTSSSDKASPTRATADRLLTTAEWLVRPSNSVISISRKLKNYLNNLYRLEAQNVASDLPSFHDKVDLAISLTSESNLTETPALLNHEPLINNETMQTAVIQKSATVRAFAPNYFASLRESFGIDESKYWQSILDEESPFVSFQSNSKGAKRVGGLFFFTRDGTYMIKTIKSDEVEAFLATILPKYGPYMKQYGRTSLLTRFCGLYQVQLSTTTHCNGTSSIEKSQIHTFAVMNSVFPAQASKLVSERFDLKGSTLGRQCSFDEIQEKGSNAILKDLDLANEVELMRTTQNYDGGTHLPQKEGLHVGPASKAHLMSQLARDVELLVRCNAIDYSLLVGVSIRKNPLFNILCSVLPLIHDAEGLEHWSGMSVSKAVTQVRLMFRKSAFYGKDMYPPFVDQLRQSTRIIYDESLEKCGVDCGPLSRMKGERLGWSSIYYFGLIDFLQPFNAKKKLEYQWKSIRHGGSKAGFSCIPPHSYANRFLAFLDRHIT